MAGYDDTRQKIISTLMGRPVGSEIQPENHQDYALNMLDYIRSLELIANGTLIGIAEANTQPIQPNDSRACYIAGVAQDRTVTFQNFRNYLGQPIQITNGQMEACLVILIWDTQYWSATQVPTNIISAAEQANFYYSYNIRKTYASISAMDADSTNPIGTDGKYIKVGDIVTVVNSTTPSENGFYSYEGSENGWLLQSGFSFEIVQTTGTDINKTMSQKAVTDELALKAEHGYESNPKTLKQVDDELADELALKVDTTSLELTTTSKTIVGAINEVNANAIINNRNIDIISGKQAIDKLIYSVYLEELNGKDLSNLDFIIKYVSYNSYEANSLGCQILVISKANPINQGILLNTIPFASWQPYNILTANDTIIIDEEIYKIRIYVTTSGEKNISSFPNTSVLANIATNNSDNKLPPKLLNQLSEVNGVVKLNSDFIGNVASDTDAYVDKSTFISSVGKLKGLIIDINTISTDNPNEAFFYIASSKNNFQDFIIKKKITVTPHLGRHTYDMSSLDITLMPRDCVIWGGFHKIWFDDNGNNAKILSKEFLLSNGEGYEFTNSGDFQYNFGIQVIQDISYEDTLNYLMENKDELNELIDDLTSNFNLLSLQIPFRESVISHSNNIFNYNDAERIVGYLVTSDGTLGAIGESPNVWYTTGYVDLLGATQIIVGLNQVAGGNGCYSLAYYDENKVFVSYQRTYGNNFDGILDIPLTAKYARFTFTNNNLWQINIGTTLMEFDEYYYNEYYYSGEGKDGKEWVFKPDVDDPDLLALIGGGVIESDLFKPTKIYTTCNDITTDEEIAGKRNYAVALFLDHMLSLNQYAKLRFDATQSDKFPVFSHFTSYGVVSGGRGWIWNEDNSIIKQTVKQLAINGIKNSGFSFTQVSTRNSATADEKPIVLCIGDSVTEGYLANINKPFPTAPNTYWQWAKMFFEFDKKQAADNSKYDSLFIGQRNVTSYQGKYIDDSMIDIRACAEGKGASLLSQYLRGTLIGGDTNHFYDADKVDTNKFSILYWLSKFRTMDDLGVRLTGSAGETVTGSDGKQYTIGTVITDLSAYDVCTPTHVVIQLGYNDGDRAGYLDDIISMMDIIQTEIPGCKVGVSLPDCPGTYFPELYPQYGNDKAEMYPVSYFHGAAQGSHNTFLSMNKKLITVDNPAEERYYIPNFFIGPTALAAPYHQNNFASYLSSGVFADELKVQGWAAPNLHPNNHAHAAWGYEIYSWIKYTLAKE